MKYFHFILLPTILLVLHCSGSKGSVATIHLSALKPDLEILRGYWLKNPEEKVREGRIIFLPSKHQILVNYETSTSPIQDDAWTTDFLRLQNIFELQSYDQNQAVDELFYKHSTFYVRSNPYELPETINNREHWITMLPINETENNQKSSIELRYVDLNTLANDINGKVTEIDAESGRSSLVSLNMDGNEFNFDYVKGRTQLFLRHVRFIENSNNENNEDTYFTASQEGAFIRYDRLSSKFYTKNGYINEGSVVRSSIRDGVLSNRVEDENSQSEETYSGGPKNRNDDHIHLTFQSFSEI